jgi:uncharacterized protein YbjT (DUF2867 family)
MILITGATGNNGGEVIAALLAHGHAGIRALVRDLAKEASKVSGFRARGIDVFEGDLSKPHTLSAAFEGIERVFLLSPVNPNMVELQGNGVAAAKAAGVKHIVKFSMIGASPTSPVPLARWHAEAEAIVERSGLAWTHLRPNDLMRYNTMLLMPTVIKDGMIYDSLGEARISMVAEQDVAAVAARALTEDGHEGKRYILTGPQALSFHDIAAALQSALGKPVNYQPISPEQAARAMAAAGLPAAAVDLVQALRAYERTDANAVLTSTVAEVLGRPPLTYGEVARDIVGAWPAGS